MIDLLVELGAIHDELRIFGGDGRDFRRVGRMDGHRLVCHINGSLRYLDGILSASVRCATEHAEFLVDVHLLDLVPSKGDVAQGSL